MRLQPEQLDVLTELINIGIGRGAASLNTMLGSHIALSVPTIQTLDASTREMQAFLRLYSNQAAVSMSFSGGFTGNSLLTFSPESALILVNSLLETESTEEAGSELDALRASALVEVGNIVMNGVMGSLSNGLGVHLQYTVPVFEHCSLESKLPAPSRDQVQLVILAKTLFRSDSLSITGEIFILVELSSIGQFVSLLNHSYEQQLGA